MKMLTCTCLFMQKWPVCVIEHKDEDKTIEKSLQRRVYRGESTEESLQRRVYRGESAEESL